MRRILLGAFLFTGVAMLIRALRKRDALTTDEPAGQFDPGPDPLEVSAEPLEREIEDADLVAAEDPLAPGVFERSPGPV